MSSTSPSRRKRPQRPPQRTRKFLTPGSLKIFRVTGLLPPLSTFHFATCSPLKASRSVAPGSCRIGEGGREEGQAPRSPDRPAAAHLSGHSRQSPHALSARGPMPAGSASAWSPSLSTCLPRRGTDDTRVRPAFPGLVSACQLSGLPLFRCNYLQRLGHSLTCSVALPFIRFLPIGSWTRPHVGRLKGKSHGCVPDGNFFRSVRR